MAEAALRHIPTTPCTPEAGSLPERASRRRVINTYMPQSILLLAMWFNDFDDAEVSLRSYRMDHQPLVLASEKGAEGFSLHGGTVCSRAARPRREIGWFRGRDPDTAHGMLRHCAGRARRGPLVA